MKNNLNKELLKEFKRLVKNINQKRAYDIKKTSNIISDKKGSNFVQAREYQNQTPFTYHKISGKTNKYNTNYELAQRIEQLKYFNTREYRDYRNNLYFGNYIKGIINNIPKSDFRDATINRLSNLSNEDFEKYILKNPDLIINFMYFDPDNNKLTTINNALDNL